MRKSVFLILAIASASIAAQGLDIHPKCLTPIVEDSAPSCAPVTLVRGGVCDFRIVWDAADKRQEKAARLLSDCFFKATGSRPSAAGKSCVSFVRSAELERTEGYAIRTTEQGLELAGHAWFAALDFCERFLGVRWYFPGEYGEIHPKIADLTVDPVSYRDEPWYRWRHEQYYNYLSVATPALLSYWRRYLGDSLTKEYVTFNFSDLMRAGQSEPNAGSHSPVPAEMAKSHPDKLKTLFYTSPHGKFWYSPGAATTGWFFDVVNLGFADILVEDWKAFYDSNGKDDRGGFAAQCNDRYVTFGNCDTYLDVQDFATDPVVRELGLFKPEDLARDRDAAMCNIYGRFFQYLGNKVKAELPGKKLALLIYYGSKCASLDPRWRLPDNVELFVCDFRMPSKIFNPKARAGIETLFNEWCEASGGRPVWKAWLYGSRNDPFGRALLPEFAAEVPKLLGNRLGRGGLFYDHIGGEGYWHFFYSAYALWKVQWNPRVDVDAVIDTMFDDLYGKKAGVWVKRFHRELKAAYSKSVVAGSDTDARIPLGLLTTLEGYLANARACLTTNSVEMKRFDLFADWWTRAFETQRTLAAYEPPVYDVRRYAGEDTDWTKVADMPLVVTRSGDKPETSASIKLLWDEKGIYGRFRTEARAAADSRKELWENDSLELFFAPGLNKEVLYQLAFDVFDQTFAGKRRLLPIPQPLDKSFKGTGFVHRAKILSSGGWSAVFFVPWSLFDEKPPKVYDSWNANLVRNRKGERKEASGTSFTMGVNAKTEMFGMLRFVGRGD